jgi:uncharacterized protein YqgV (UPF0045/DUF77 family)
VYRVDFTIEPFVEGRPGPHVTAAVEAVQALGLEVDIGPFGSSCTVEGDSAPDVVAAIVRAAVEHGATHVNVDVTDEGAS